MKSLREILEKADTGKSAIGHFNGSDLVTLKAVFEAARGLKVPVIVGVSEGERQFMGRFNRPWRRQRAGRSRIRWNASPRIIIRPILRHIVSRPVPVLPGVRKCREE